jgi:hypothetical protein
MAVMLLPFAILAEEQDANSTTIEWDAATLQLVEPRGSYGRMARLSGGAVACVFDRDAKMWIRHSEDDGKTWGKAILVASNPDSWLTNADLLPLKNGQLLYFWNDRPLAAMQYAHRRAPAGALKTPFRICMSRSGDNGKTWSSPQTLYSAGVSFGDGCWEPAALELPTGEIHVCFANESPFRDSSEQEISLLRSCDGGKSWLDAVRVSYRAGHRDGMPAPLLLADKQSIVMAIEDNGLDGDAFKPAIIRIPLDSIDHIVPVSGDSPNRWGALKLQLSAKIYGGAPCLRQLPSGLTLLSYQESDDGKLESCRLAVCIGSPGARDFVNKTYPLPPEARLGQKWNSLFIKDESHVTAISSASIKGQSGIWAIDGCVVQQRDKQ